MRTSDLSEKAYQITKEKIINYEKGKYLSARSFSNDIGMSYTPVREAFIRLQKEGFLERVPNVGFFVVNLDIKDVLEIFQVRECVEKFVFQAAFDSISDNDIQNMRKLIVKQKDALKKGDIRQYIKIDEQFHLVFFNIYGNKHLTDLIKNVRERYLFCSNEIAKSGSMEGINEHNEIIEQIAAKNKETAVKLMEKHIDTAKQRMKEGFINALDV